MSVLHVNIQESDLGGEWKILDRPPVGDGIDLEKQEHQQVVVDFRLSDGLPDDTRHYVIQRDKSGSYEVLSTGLIDDDKVSQLNDLIQNSGSVTLQGM